MTYVQKSSSLYSAFNEIRKYLISEVYRRYKSIYEFCRNNAFTVCDRSIQRISEERDISIHVLEEVAAALGYKLVVSLEENNEIL